MLELNICLEAFCNLSEGDRAVVCNSPAPPKAEQLKKEA